MNDYLRIKTEVDRERYAMKHFNKHDGELSLEENQAVDAKYPGWGLVSTAQGVQLEISMGGTRVRRTIDKKEIPILYPIKNTNMEYASVTVYNSRTHVSNWQSVHRLVANAFIPNPDERPEVNHIDGNKLNNHYKNLEWVTASENQQHALRTGLRPTGEDLSITIYSEDQVRQACDLLENDLELTITDISNLTGIKRPALAAIYNGHAWVNISKDYDFSRRRAYVVSPIGREYIEPPPQHVGPFIGENNGNSVYTTDKIIEVCELLQNHPEISYREIEKRTGVNFSAVSSIYTGETWRHISKDYNFPPRKDNVGENNGKAKYTVDQIEKVCTYLDDVFNGKIKMTNKEIGAKCGVPKGIVEHIRGGTRWTTVSKNHDFYKIKFENN